MDDRSEDGLMLAVLLAAMSMNEGAATLLQNFITDEDATIVAKQIIEVTEEHAEIYEEWLVSQIVTLVEREKLRLGVHTVH